MPERDMSEPPTFYANIISVTVDPDVAYFELRRFIRPHRDVVKDLRQGAASEPPVAEAAIYEQEPIARMVLTFSAVKVLQAQLADLVPKMEQARRGPM